MFSAKDMPLAGRGGAREIVAGSAVRVVLVATSAAVVGALTTHAVARDVSGELVVEGPGGATGVPVGAVVVATGLAGLGAWGLAALAARTRTPRTALVGLIALGLALSSVPPVLAATTATTAAWLLAMHLVVAVPLVRLAWRLMRRSA